MNKLIYIIIIALAGVFFACENERQQYDLSVSALNVSLVDTVYSFAAKPSTLEIDTVALIINLIGETKDYERTFQLRATANNTLKQGYHYEFSELKLAANRTSDTLGLILHKREDLKDTTFLLELEFVANENFREGVDRKIKLWVSDKLVKPSNWSSTLEVHFGVYSEVKHSLIIDATGIYDFNELGLGIIRNMALMAKNHLQEINIEREKQGKGLLEDEFKRVVVIGSN